MYHVLIVGDNDESDSKLLICNLNESPEVQLLCLKVVQHFVEYEMPAKKPEKRNLASNLPEICRKSG